MGALSPGIKSGLRGTSDSAMTAASSTSSRETTNIATRPRSRSISRARASARVRQDMVAAVSPSEACIAAA